MQIGGAFLRVHVRKDLLILRAYHKDKLLTSLVFDDTVGRHKNEPPTS